MTYNKLMSTIDEIISSIQTEAVTSQCTSCAAYGVSHVCLVKEHGPDMADHSRIVSVYPVIKKLLKHCPNTAIVSLVNKLIDRDYT